MKITAESRAPTFSEDDWMCPFCGHTGYEPVTIMIPVSVIASQYGHGLEKKEFHIGFSCRGCSATFLHPDKFRDCINSAKSKRLHK